MLFKRSKLTNSSVRAPIKNQDSRSSAYSYYAAKEQRENSSLTPRKVTNASQYKNRGKYWLKLMPTLLAGGLIFFCVLCELILGTTPKIIILGNETDLQKNFMQSNSIYENAAQKFLSSSITNRNKLTINTTAIDEQMQKRFPEIASVSMTLPLLGHKPLMYILPVTPSLILQNRVSNLFLVDSEGNTFATISSLNNVSKLMPLVVEQTASSISLGQTVLSQSEIAFIQLIESQLKTKGIAIQSLVLPSDSLEFDVHLANAQYFVKFNLDDSQDAGQQIGTFLATRNYLIKNNIIPTQYIDARDIGRVFYK